MKDLIITKKNKWRLGCGRNGHLLNSELKVTINIFFR